MSILETRIKLSSIGLESIKATLGTQFYNMEHVIEALYYGVYAGKNIILYGPGGFGKTELTKSFLKLLDINTSVIVGYEDMEVDALLGIPNIKKLTEESVYQIDFNKTVFANEGVLILEEFLDVRPSTAAALKDILSEGGYRTGSNLVKSNISSVIICTNKSPDEVSTDNSTSAFYKERFPIRINVSWNNFDYETFSSFFKVSKPVQYNANKTLYEVLIQVAIETSKTSIVSPRMLKDASDLIDLHGTINVIKFIEGLDTLELSSILTYCHFVDEKSRLQTIHAKVHNYYTELSSKVTTKNVPILLQSIAELSYICEKIRNITVEHVDNTTIITDLYKLVSDKEANLRNLIDYHMVSEEKKQVINGLFL